MCKQTLKINNYAYQNLQSFYSIWIPYISISIHKQYTNGLNWLSAQWKVMNFLISMTSTKRKNRQENVNSCKMSIYSLIWFGWILILMMEAKIKRQKKKESSCNWHTYTNNHQHIHKHFVLKVVNWFVRFNWFLWIHMIDRHLHL